MQLFQDFILSQWIILIALGIVFLIVSRWALSTFEEYPGYILGWLVGLFFIIVRLSVGRTELPTDTIGYLNGIQVFAATLFGLLMGSVIVLALRYGMRQAQAISLQVAIYTAMLIIMMFLVFIGSPVTQKMIGIFGLAIGIATLFAMVLFPSQRRKEQLNIKAQGATSGITQGSQPIQTNPNIGQGGGQPPASRLDQIRQSQNSKLGR
ncbi:MAG: hypothetical protein WBC91_05395 [Phototrophicaceae bacterium]